MMDRILKQFLYFVLAAAVATFAFTAQAKSSRHHAKAVHRPAAVVTQKAPIPDVMPLAKPALPAVAAVAAAAHAPRGPANPAAPAPAAKAATQPQSAAFDANAAVIELKHVLVAARPDAGERQARWYVFKAVNNSGAAVSRILLAGQPPHAGLSFFPRPVRPAVVQVASVDPAISILPTRDYGRHGYLITVPPKKSAMMAVRVVGGDDPPYVLAWAEASLAAHNRWLAIFVAAVAGLIAASAAIAGGLALLSRHAAPRWAAWMLLALFMMRLAGFGLFDRSLITPVGGPYGLLALFAGLSVVAGLRLLNMLLPFRAVWPAADRWLTKILYGVVGVSVLAYLGVPGTTVLVDTVGVLASLGAAAFVIFSWQRGTRAARALAPGVILFALFSLASIFISLGGFGEDCMPPDIAGGFLASGAVLLVLALVAGEGSGLTALARLGHAGAGQPPATPAAPVPHAAIEAIGASFQGVFELDLQEDKVILSREAAVLFGLGRRVHTLRGQAWVARIHPDDRPVYEKAMADFSNQTDFAFRIEFRARDDDGRYLWFELRAAMKGPVDGPAERCVGLIADVTMRKETEAAAMERTMRDSMTGLGNTVALMEELERLGGNFTRAQYALVDIDGFKTLRAAKGDACCDEVLSRLAERLERFAGKRGCVFRVGGNAFAVLLYEGGGDPAGFGEALVQSGGEAYRLEGHNVYAPVSVGVAEGRTAQAPLNLVGSAAVALRFARFKGGSAAVVFTPGMEMMAPSDATGIEAGLYRALEHGEIDVCYQPIVRLSDRTVAGFAAVPRWNHPEKGPISPHDLIAHSDDAGLMTALARFTLKRAAGDLAEWQRYFPLVEALFVGVRLSERQLQIAELDEFLCSAVKSAGLVPNTLLLEFSGKDFSGEDGGQRLQKLRRAGVGLILRECCADDAKPAPAAAFAAVKIDKRCLLRHGSEIVVGEEALAGVIGSAHQSGRNVISDGVESEDDAERLARLGCDMAQGFLFSEALAVSDALNYIAQNFRSTDGEQG